MDAGRQWMWTRHSRRDDSHPIDIVKRLKAQELRTFHASPHLFLLTTGKTTHCRAQKHLGLFVVSFLPPLRYHLECGHYL